MQNLRPMSPIGLREKELRKDRLFEQAPDSGLGLVV